MDNPFSTGAGVDYAQWRSPPDPQALEHAAGATVSRSDLTPTGSGRIFYMLMPWILPALVPRTTARSRRQHSKTPHSLGVCRSTFLTRPWSQ